MTKKVGGSRHTAPLRHTKSRRGNYTSPIRGNRWTTERRGHTGPRQVRHIPNCSDPDFDAGGSNPVSLPRIIESSIQRPTESTYRIDQENTKPRHFPDDARGCQLLNLCHPSYQSFHRGGAWSYIVLASTISTKSRTRTTPTIMDDHGSAISPGTSTRPVSATTKGECVAHVTYHDASWIHCFAGAVFEGGSSSHNLALLGVCRICSESTLWVSPPSACAFRPLRTYGSSTRPYEALIAVAGSSKG